MSFPAQKLVNNTPDYILFAQHGWADNSQDIAALAGIIATPNTLIITPDLGWIKTWLWIDPLIQHVEKVAIDAIARHPNTPIRIIGHSMGGLIWLEVLNRHPEWWLQVESLVLIASPVGGAHLARIFDPLEMGIGIARDLGRNRRRIAELIAEVIPTLVIAGNVDDGSDGTVIVEATQFSHAKFICLPGIPHAALKKHPSLVEIIRNFWNNPEKAVSTDPDLVTMLIQLLRSVPGMTDAHRRDFYQSKPYLTLKDGLAICTWKNFWQIEHVFLTNDEKQYLYGGFVGWLHAEDLRKTLEDVKEQYQHLT